MQRSELQFLPPHNRLSIASSVFSLLFWLLTQQALVVIYYWLSIASSFFNLPSFFWTVLHVLLLLCFSDIFCHFWNRFSLFITLNRKNEQQIRHLYLLVMRICFSDAVNTIDSVIFLCRITLLYIYFHNYEVISNDHSLIHSFCTISVH